MPERRIENGLVLVYLYLDIYRLETNLVFSPMCLRLFSLEAHDPGTRTRS
jgi:hypothetical protein